MKVWSSINKRLRMATPNPKIKGPGLLYVTSRIASPDILDEKTYFKWYDEDHIDEIVHTSGMPSAFRYRDIDLEEKERKKEKVYLAFYPMQDLAFTQGEEFRKIRVKSDLLPGSGIIYDLADLDVRYLGLVDKTERKKEGVAECVVVFGVEPGKGMGDDVVEKWFKDEVRMRLPVEWRIVLTVSSIYPPLRASKVTFDPRSITSNTHEPMLNQEH